MTTTVSASTAVLDDLQAGVLSVKLKHITAWTDRRIELAAKYDKGLKNLKFITIPTVAPATVTSIISMRSKP